MFHAILLLQLAATTPQARAAETLVHASISHYEHGDFEQALAEAEQAYRLYPLAQILFNIGQCDRALQHWDKAAFFYRRYLEKLPDAPNRPLVEQLLAEVEYRLEAQQSTHRAPPAENPVPEAPAAPMPAPTLPAAPPPALTMPVEAEPPPRHSHVLAIGLLAGGVVAGGLGGYGQFEVQTYLADRGVARAPNNGSYTHLFDEQQAAQGWLWPSVILGVLAAAGLTAGAITW